jgi:hypothetical protein
MRKYKFTYNGEETIIEEKNKDKASREFCRKLEDEGILTIEKIKASEESEVNVDTGENVDEGMYWQQSSRYNGIMIGNSSTPINSDGCALMCLSKAFKKDPLEVNQLFIDKGVYYNEDLIVFEKAIAALGGSNYSKDTDINNMPSKSPTIKEVLFGGYQHFVVRYVGEDEERYIFDPWTGNYETINYYPTFKSYRVFDM